MCERGVGDGTDWNLLTPSSSGHRGISSSFCWAAQPGSWGSKPSVSSWFSLPRTATRTPTNWLQLTETVCGTGLYNCLTSTFFLWRCNCTEFNPSTGKVITWYLRPDAPVSWLTARSKVYMLHYCLTQVHLFLLLEYMCFSMKPLCSPCLSLVCIITISKQACNTVK